jgi:hypothetical protein
MAGVQLLKLGLAPATLCNHFLSHMCCSQAGALEETVKPSTAVFL